MFVSDDGRLTARFDVNVHVAWRDCGVVVDNVPRIKHVAIPVDCGDDIVAVARKIFAVGLPQ